MSRKGEDQEKNCKLSLLYKVQVWLFGLFFGHDQIEFCLLITIDMIKLKKNRVNDLLNKRDYENGILEQTSS